MNAPRCHICTYIAFLVFILVPQLFMQSALICVSQIVFSLRVFFPPKTMCVCVCAELSYAMLAARSVSMAVVS